MMDEKPGARALIVMKNMRNEIIDFKKPKEVVKKTKKKILTEEQYIQEMGKIIQRDFFPDLEKLVAQNEYLEAKEKNDIYKLRQLYDKYSQGNLTMSRRMANESPATFETPFVNPNSTPLPSESGTPLSTTSVKTNTENTNTGITIDENHSLDSFLQNYTSEDNQSFQEIMEKAEEKLKQKFAILYNAEKMSAIEFEKKLVLPAIDKQFSIKYNGEVDTWKYTNKNTVMYIPDGVDFTEAERLEFAKRRPAVVHSNTRLKTSFKNPIPQGNDTGANNRLTVEKVDIDGNIVKKPENPNSKYDFVRTPSPHPSEMGSPLMTWGEIEGTPFRLDGSDTPICSIPGPSFRIKETPRRECIAHELAEKAGERLRNQKQNAIEAAKRNISSPYIKSVIDRKLAMSPAARKLAASSRLKVRTSLMTPRGTSKTPDSLRRANKINTTPIIIRKTPLINTPNSNKSNNSDIQSNKDMRNSRRNVEDLTSNLLNIPKRTKASDFF